MARCVSRASLGCVIAFSCNVVSTATRSRIFDRTGAVRHRRFYVAYAGRYPPGRKLLSVILRVRYVVGVLIRHPRVKSACLFRNAVDEFLQDETGPRSRGVAPSLTAPPTFDRGGVCEGKRVTCPNISTETRFNAEWRRLYLDLGIQSVQSAPVFSFNGKALGTFVVAFNEPRAAASFDMEMTAFGVYAMRTILRRAAT
jgi:hypothetical protein